MFVFIALVMVFSPILVMIFFVFYKLVILFGKSKQVVASPSKKINHPDFSEQSSSIYLDLATPNDEIIAVITAAVNLFYQKG